MNQAQKAAEQCISIIDKVVPSNEDERRLLKLLVYEIREHFQLRKPGHDITAEPFAQTEWFW